MAKRRTKRPYELGKRCACRVPDTCTHDWWLRVFARGKRQRVNVTERYALALPMTRADVEVHAAKAKDEARRGVLHPSTGDSRLTLGDVADRYVAAYPDRSHYYVTGLRETTVPGASGAIVKVETKPIDEVTTSDIKHAVRKWRERKRTSAAVQQGNVAIRHLLQTARHLFNWAIKEGYATRTPFLSPQGVTMISIKSTKGRSRRLEEGEEQRILDAACPFIAEFFVAMIETGCRPGELRTLQWSEVREDYLIVLAEKAKDREERRIPIMPTLREILDRRKLGPDGAELPSDAHVFGSETGDLFSKERVCELWRRTCERAKVKNLHLHDLRGEAGSQLLEAGVPIHEVRDALGHSSTTMTSAYLRTRVNSLKQAYERRHRLRVVPRGQSRAKGA